MINNKHVRYTYMYMGVYVLVCLFGVGGGNVFWVSFLFFLWNPWLVCYTHTYIPCTCACMSVCVTVCVHVHLQYMYVCTFQISNDMHLWRCVVESVIKKVPVQQQRTMVLACVIADMYVCSCCSNCTLTHTCTCMSVCSYCSNSLCTCTSAIHVCTFQISNNKQLWWVRGGVGNEKVPVQQQRSMVLALVVMCHC